MVPPVAQLLWKEGVTRARISTGTHEQLANYPEVRDQLMWVFVTYFGAKGSKKEPVKREDGLDIEEEDDDPDSWTFIE